jgi:ketosteroid isomerase-like protein
MRKYILAAWMLLGSIFVMAQSKSDTREIYAIMNRQTADWNSGNIKAFMNGYWESDSLMFVGKNGPTYGYNATYQNYLKRYPDRAAMGTLKFEYIRLSFPGPDVAFLLGKFHLTRPEKGDLSGFYTLLWRKIKGKWVIVSDHTS